MKNLITILLLLFTTFFFAQNRLTGRIVNEKNEPLQDVHIHLLRLDTDSDAQGIYNLKAIPNGTFILYATHLGYENFQIKLSFNNQDVTQNIIMRSKMNFIEEVHIEKVSHNTRNVVNSNKIKSSQIEKLSDRAFAEALKEVSGVTVLKSGNAFKPMINGLHSSRITIINNNIRMEDQQWGLDHAPNLDLGTIGKISVIKGSNALQYSGDAIGGLVIVEPLDIKKDTLMGKSNLTYNSNGRGTYFNTSVYKGKVQGFGFDFNASFKYFGDKNAPDYMLSNTGLRDYALASNLYYTKKDLKVNGFVSYFNTNLGILKASHTGNSNDLLNSITNLVPSEIDPFSYKINNPRQAVSHVIGKLAVDWKNLKFQYAFQFNDREEFDLRRGANANRPALSLGLTTQSVLLDWSKEIRNLKFKSGLNTSFQVNDARPETGIRPLIPYFTKKDAGIYSIVNYQFSEHFSGEYGFRFDYSQVEAHKFYLKERWKELSYDSLYPQFFVKEQNNQILMNPNFEYLNFSSSFGGNYHFSEHWNWLPTISYIMRNPNPSELFSDGLHHAIGMIELGSLSLKREEGLKMSSVFKYSSTKWDLELNPYVNLFSNFIYSEPVKNETSNRGSFLVWNYTQAKARIYGFDLASNYQINNHFWHKINLAWLNGQNLSKNEPLIDMAPFSFSNEFTYSTNALWNATFSLKSEFVGKQTRVPNNNFEIRIIKNNAYEDVLVDISASPKAYHLLHFNAGFEPKLLKSVKTTLNIGLGNIFDVKYRDYLNRQRFFADELGRNIRLQLKFNY